jgi:hypothetical protein
MQIDLQREENLGISHGHEPEEPLVSIGIAVQLQRMKSNVRNNLILIDLELKRCINFADQQTRSSVLTATG